MKHLNRFWTHIHSLSEEARKLLALAASAVFAILIFSLWMGNTSSNLQNIPLPNPAPGPQALAPQIEEKEASALGPAAGIAESIRSLGFVFPNLNIGKKLGQIEMNDLYDSYNATEKSVKKTLAAVSETIYVWADKMGRKVYTP